MKYFFTFLISIFLFSASFASSITGYIFDRNSREQLVGAIVVLNPGKANSSSMLNGKYSLSNIQVGSYKIEVSYLGYKTIDTTLRVLANMETKLNFYLVSNTTNLGTVTVTSKGGKESDGFAKRREQKADNLVNIVSANSITISPDITVANVMARVSGVSIERGNTGEGQYAIIRGMDKRYNTTLINGIKIPSPDNKNRYVPLDIFPSDLIERIEVSKSLAPEMEGDASGGVINLVMKTAPEDFRLEGNVGSGYSGLFSKRPFDSFNTSTVNKKSPAEILGAGIEAPISAFPYQNLITSTKKSPVNSNYSLTIGNRFLNKKLGVIFSGSYQNTYAGNNTSRLVENATLGPAQGPNAEMTQVFPEYLTRKYSSLTDRLGLISTLDYRFNHDNAISLFGTYLQLNENRVRLTNDLLLGNYSYQGYTGGFQQSYETQTRQDLQGIYSLILHGDNKLAGLLTSDWSLAYSEAKQQLPDMAAFNTTREISPNTSGTATSIAYGPLNVRPEKREWSHNTDKDISGYLNFHYNTEIKGRKSLFTFGGMFRHKNRDNYDNKYSLNATPDPNSTEQDYISIAASQFKFIPHTDALGTAFSNAGVYTFNENIQGAFGEAKYFIKDGFDVLFGLRVENTRQVYDSSLPVSIAGKSARISYMDFLPSLNAKYSLSNNEALRLSYFTSVLRPAYSDLVPYLDKTGFSQDDFGTIGNPNLQHTVINNFDFRYEMFPKGLDQFMIGAFYKSIANPIEYALVQTSYAADLELTPNNFGTAHKYGLEAVFRKYFGEFGISGNYTYTYSVINSTKKFNYIDPSNNSFHNIEISQSRPLQGQAAHIGIKRSAFQGDSNVYANVVNAAMVAKMNALPTVKLPNDEGVNSGNLIGGIDYLLNTGDIANREEFGIQSAATSWSQFRTVYLEGVTLKNRINQPTKILLLAGNHDISNAIGHCKKLNPLTDNTALVGIYNYTFPEKQKTTGNYQYSTDKIHYSKDMAGIHCVFINMWPDSSERVWIEKDLKTISRKTPVLLFTHDQPNVESKHFTNPNGLHTINSSDNFENLIPEVFKDGKKTSDPTKIEQRSFVAFLKMHPNIKAYFNGNDHENIFYDYKGPDNDIILKTFQVDSPMKGNKSARDEKKLSFQLISLDPRKKRMTVRECLWNMDPKNPNAPILWGESATISLQ